MAKVPGKGTILSHGVAGSPIVYTAITQRASIDGPDATVGTAKTTDLDSVAEEYRPTLPDGGELSMEIWYDPAGTTHKLLTTFQVTPSVELWQLTFADTGVSKIPFSGILTGFKPAGMNPDGYLTASIKIKSTGGLTWPT
jgi:hypothetical protein